MTSMAIIFLFILVFFFILFLFFFLSSFFLELGKQAVIVRVINSYTPLVMHHVYSEYTLLIELLFSSSLLDIWMTYKGNFTLVSNMIQKYIIFER